MDKVILPACYLPPVSYFAAMLHHSADELLIEQFEHFPKQTYRNRASIYGANGKLDLIIPIQHDKGLRHRIKDVRISYESDWQRLHWMSIQTAYRSSSYFEYYEDYFEPFYTRKHEFLLDYNLKLTELITKLLKLDIQPQLTADYQEYTPPDQDLRDSIHPKKTPYLLTKEYYQLFADKYGFLKDLSIVDLLFNHGPQSTNYISP